MRRFVIEPAVAVKWFVPEIHSSSSARLLDGGHELLALETIIADFGKMITYKVRTDECSADEGVQLLEAIRSAPLLLHPIDDLLEPALRIACDLNRPLGDGLNLSLAVASDCRLVTANGALYETLLMTAFSLHVKWVGDLR
jgi:predicted nucleic acid-binding protein